MRTLGSFVRYVVAGIFFSLVLCHLREKHLKWVTNKKMPLVFVRAVVLFVSMAACLVTWYLATGYAHKALSGVTPALHFSQLCYLRILVIVTLCRLLQLGLLC